MPFGDYEDFDDCVRKNQDKEDPEAYCAAIKKAIEGQAQSEQVIHGEDNLASGRRRPVDISGRDYDGD